MQLLLFLGDNNIGQSGGHNLAENIQFLPKLKALNLCNIFAIIIPNSYSGK